MHRSLVVLAVLVVLLGLGMTAACSGTAADSDPEPSLTPTESVEAPATETNGDGPSTISSLTGNGNADVTFVEATQAENGTWTFDVTVEHPDTGWDNYADGWNVLSVDGDVLKASAGDSFTRLLIHPHVDEQPFTRSQSGIVIPDEVRIVVVGAHDSVDGFGGRAITVDLLATSGEGFEIMK